MTPTFQPRTPPHRRKHAEPVSPSGPPVLAQITDVHMDESTGAMIVTFDRPVACVAPAMSELGTSLGVYASSMNLSDNVIRFDPQCGAGDSSGLPWSWNYGADLFSPPADPAQTGTVD